MVIFLPAKWKRGSIYQEKAGKKLIKLAIHRGFRCCKEAIEKGKLQQLPCKAHFRHCSECGGHRMHKWREFHILAFSEYKSHEKLV